MRKMKITCMGPLGYKDSVDVICEDALLLTWTGEVKPAKKLHVGDGLIRFGQGPRSDGGHATRWIITNIEWMRWWR